MFYCLTGTNAVHVSEHYAQGMTRMNTTYVACVHIYLIRMYTKTHVCVYPCLCAVCIFFSACVQ